MLTRALDQCLTAAEPVHDIAAFKAWTREFVRPVVGHRHLACGYGRTTSSGVAMDYVVTVDYPNEHLLAIRNTAGGIDTPIMRRWLVRAGRCTSMRRRRGKAPIRHGSKNS